MFTIYGQVYVQRWFFFRLNQIQLNLGFKLSEKSSKYKELNAQEQSLWFALSSNKSIWIVAHG